MNSAIEKKIRQTVRFYNGFSEKYDRKYNAYLNHTHMRLCDELPDLTGDRVLDISGGTGRLAEEIIKNYSGVDYVLNDPSEGMRSVAMARFERNSSVTFSKDTAEDLSFPSKSFDRVLCLNSFHYYGDQDLALKNMHEVLKKNGTLHVLDWNLEGWFHLPNAIIAALTPENINTKSVEEAREMMAANGFNIMKMQTWSYRFWKFYLIEAAK